MPLSWKDRKELRKLYRQYHAAVNRSRLAEFQSPDWFAAEEDAESIWDEIMKIKWRNEGTTR